MTDEPAGVALSLFALFLYAWSCCTYPTHARCAAGWWAPEGVRGGELVCRPRPVGPDERDARGIVVDHSVQPPGETRVRLWCTGGATLRQDGESAWCQR